MSIRSAGPPWTYPSVYACTLGFHNADVGDGRVVCDDCAEIVKREGSIMRGHRRRCRVRPEEVYTPAVCDS